ncbi:MAG: LacI family transcriptional regulator [bacterium]|nr:LacI family transcriptional regulator [bacterium]
MAVDHLAGQGRRKIALAMMTRSRPEDIARYQGYAAGLKAHGLEVDESLIFDSQPHGMAFAKCNEPASKWEFPSEITQKAINQLVREAGADAIVAHDDFWAAAIMKQLRARGISVPHDVAVLGYLNHYLADWTDPGLTTIDLQHWQAAQTMVGMLERMVTHGPLPAAERVVKIQPKLIVRESA